MCSVWLESLHGSHYDICHLKAVSICHIKTVAISEARHYPRPLLVKLTLVVVCQTRVFLFVVAACVCVCGFRIFSGIESLREDREH